MSLIIFYDTETTDKSDFKAAYDAPQQPDLVQLGYKVVDIATRETVFEIGHLVNTTEFPSYKMSPEAQKVHGISTELVREYGWSPNDSISLFQRWVNRSAIKVAHNDQFDTRIMQCFAKRSGWSPDIFPKCEPVCTMMKTTNVCKLPGKYGFKWPSLAEAYRHFTGKEIDGAHNALVDVNACIDIFWGLVDSKHIALRPDYDRLP